MTESEDVIVQRSELSVERSESAAAVDSAHPWLGLASFSEETRAYFFGREDEIAELGRRVQRKLLTVLFGQSGLGKTSILRAGIVPRLRPEGYCPVYVRLDYGREAPLPAEQIKAAIVRASEAGNWTRTGVAAPGESLWEFLHHRDDTLRDAGGRTLIPLLIFDQFEEVFTLAQSDDFGRERARGFLRELADLVENRPPADLEARIERDDALAEKFDFARADYRILIALREDYLANLEGLKTLMPSVTQNRQRLARMNGTQALEAVLQPGKGLVHDEVARQIVLFISGATELAHAEVEPSLLSLVCRELNEARLARGQPEITADLLAGSRDTIIAEFYERSLADQPVAVRHFIEDVLLTDSGFRENVAEERVRKAFVAAGAPDALRQLVDRRLLRVEERLDVRRVELTHDVLCGVVSASRDARREREAAEAAERRARETEAREAATRLAMWRARIVALCAAVLCVIAIGGAVFGYVNQRAARTAERRARVAELAARRTAYDSDMNVAGQALADGVTGRVRDLLAVHRPAPGQADLRGWEWRYLWGQSRGTPHETLCRKPYEINSLAVSSDGRWLAIGEVHAGGLSIWDVGARKEVYHLQPDAIETTAAFSPTEPLLAYWCSSVTATQYRGTGIRLFNVSTGKAVREIPFDGRCRALAFSRDGRELAVADRIGISLWSIPSGAKLNSYPVQAMDGPPVNVRFSTTPDLSRAAWVQLDGTAHVIDLRSGALEYSLPALDKTFLFHAVALSPDGRTLAVGEGNQVRLCDIATHRIFGALRTASGFATELSFSADGKRLISAGTDQAIRVWNLASQTCERVLLGHRSEVWRVALFPDGHTLASGGKDGLVCLWNLSGAATSSNPVTLDAHILAWGFGAGSRSVITLDDHADVVRWFGKEYGQRDVLIRTGWVNPGATAVSAPALFSRDLHWLALSLGQGDVTVWDLQRRLRAQTFVINVNRRIIPLQFFADDRRLLLVELEPGNLKPRMLVWDLASGREILSWPADLNTMNSIAVMPGERSCAVFGWEGAVIKDLDPRSAGASGAGGFDIPEGAACALSPDGRQLAVASYLGLVRVFNADSGAPETTLTDVRNAAYAVDYSPDGQRLLIADAHSGLRLCDTSNWSETLTLPTKDGQFASIGFSPDGDCLGVLMQSGTLQIWRAPTWAEINAAEPTSTDFSVQR